MNAVFLRLCNMGITAGWIVLGLLLVRLLIRKAPRWITCLLWGIVGLRLVVPVNLISNFSLLPSAQPIPTDLASMSSPRLQTGIPAVNNVANPVIEKAGDLPGLINILAIIWLAGVGAMLLYGVISYLLLRRKVATAVSDEPGIYLCDYVDTPFVLGFFRPRIYLPSDLNDDCKTAVLAHERVHLQRRDHWWKPLGYVLLSVYWFNPLLWVAYILLCRDIESACDEAVIKAMDLQERKDYSLALAECSVHRFRVLTCPVAFGEVGVKARIKAVLSYKKPAFWIIIAAVALTVAAAVCLLTVPKPCDHTYVSVVTTEASCTREGVMTYTCSLCQDRYTEPAPMPEHAYEMGDVITEADCVQPGLANFTCSDCGHNAELPIGLNDAHQYEDKVTKEATCVEEGELTQTCKLCSHVQVTAIPLADHDYRVLLEVKGSCVDSGVRELICNVCEHQTREFTPATGEHYFVGPPGYEICIHCNKRGRY